MMAVYHPHFVEVDEDGWSIPARLHLPSMHRATRYASATESRPGTPGGHRVSAVSYGIHVRFGLLADKSRKTAPPADPGEQEGEG